MKHIQSKPRVLFSFCLRSTMSVLRGH